MTPFVGPYDEIRSDWIDYNGHLNMAFYNVLFDRGADAMFETFGLTADYVRQRKLSFYVAELHVCYVREIHLGDSVQTTFQILDFDEKRLHGFQELRHSDGWLSATSEVLYLHIDATGPKVAPIPEEMRSEIARIRHHHAQLPRPERAGSSIGIVRK
jgi:acyl-CoA thioester hydrolase